MPTSIRSQLIVVLTLTIGLAFLYQPTSILLKGIALPLLTISSILSATSFSNKWSVEIIAGLGLLTGLVFLYLPVSEVLRTSAFHLIFASAIAFGMTTRFRRSMAILGAIVLIVGVASLYQPYTPLQRTALYLILLGMTLYAILSPQNWWIERVSIGAIAFGLIFLCQPFQQVLYQTGFQILLGGLTGFVIVAHR